MTESDYPYFYVWANNPKRATLYLRACRVLYRMKKGSVSVEFEDGQREVVSSRALRRRQP
jgi:hypothetical protein